MLSATRLLCVFVLALLITPISSFAQYMVANVHVGFVPYTPAVNSLTNKIYTPNEGDGTVTVVDGDTFATTNIPVGGVPYQAVVNEVTNEIYVSTWYEVVVIDGVTNQVTHLSLVGSQSLAVNPVTNKIYVSQYPQSITVIDGATLSTMPITVGEHPMQVAVDNVANQIYATMDNGNVAAIDGQTNVSSFIPATNPLGPIVVDAQRHKIYITSWGTGSPPAGVTAIDGPTHVATTIPLEAGQPSGIAINRTTNKIYAPIPYNGNQNGTVAVIDGATLALTELNPGFQLFGNVPIDIDSQRNMVYMFADVYLNRVMVVLNASDNTFYTLLNDFGAGNIVVSSATNRIYIANGNSSISAFNGPTPLQFIPMSPCRIVDTRNPDGPLGGPSISGNTFRAFPLPQSQDCNIPDGALAYSLNVTVVPHQTLGYLTIWPATTEQPVVSTMNSSDGRTKANAAVVPSGYQGGVSVYVTDTSDVILDISGYFTSSSPSTLKFYPLTPCRVADTRNSQFPQGLGSPHLNAAVTRDFPVLNSSCIPSGVNAAAYSFNLTAIPYPSFGDRLGFLEVWATGQEPQNPVSTLNNPTGTYVANAAIVPAGSDGEITVYPSDDTDLAIDINGYFSSTGSGGLSLYPSSPCRVFDTRQTGNGEPFINTLSPPVDVTGSPCGIPASAQAYVFNATVVPAERLGYLTLWPDDEDQPAVSTLNAVDRLVTSNMAIVPNVNGSIDAYASAYTQLILDISSFFAP
jgi:DNA-binding beta-propeller fold protein YncE